MDRGSAPDTIKSRIETQALDECLRFYTELLGLVILERWDEPGDRGVVLGLAGRRRSEAMLELAKSETANTTGSPVLQFRIANLDGLLQRLDGRWPYEGPEDRPWGSIYVRLQDPAGTRIVLYQET